MLIRILLLVVLGAIAYWRFGLNTAIVVVVAYVAVVALLQYFAARANQQRAVQILRRPLSADEKLHMSDVESAQARRAGLLSKRPKEGGWS